MIYYSVGQYSDETHYHLGWFSSEESAEEFARKLDRIENLLKVHSFNNSAQNKDYVSRKLAYHRDIFAPLEQEQIKILDQRYPKSTPYRSQKWKKDYDAWVDTLPVKFNDNLQNLKDDYNQKQLVMNALGEEAESYAQAYETFMSEVSNTDWFYGTNGFCATALKSLESK